MKRNISLVLVLAMVFSLCACSIGHNTLLTVGFLDEINNLNPLTAEGDGERMIAANCFEGLLHINSEGHIDLCGATAYMVNKNGLTYTFKLNPDARWYISKDFEATLDSLDIKDFDAKITAEDYIFGIQQFILSQNTALSSIRGATAYAKSKSTDKFGVVAVDEHTLEITLEKPDPDFLYKLATELIYPCEKVVFEALKGIYCSTPSTTLFNGPYYVENLNESEAIITRNPDYKGRLQVENQGVRLYFTGKEDTVFTRFDEGNYDCALADYIKCSEISEKPSFSSVSSVWGFAFNYRSDIGKNTKLREILLGSIDYENIKIPNFAIDKAIGLIPQGFTVNDKLYSDYIKQELVYPTLKNPDKALDSLLKSQGVNSYSLTVAVPKEFEKSMKSIIAGWQELFGEKLVAELRIFNLSDTEETLSEAHYDLALLPLTPETPTAFGMASAITKAPCHLNNKKLLSTVGKAYPAPEDNAVSISKIVASISNSNIFVPLFFTGTSLYMNENVSGIYLADGGNLIYFHLGVKTEV